MTGITPESLIPPGIYCYSRDATGALVNCPFWGRDKSKPEQESGYCLYLDTRDWDEGVGVPLLWDSIKECGINRNLEEYE